MHQNKFPQLQALRKISSIVRINTKTKNKQNIRERTEKGNNNKDHGEMKAIENKDWKSKSE